MKKSSCLKVEISGGGKRQSSPMPDNVPSPRSNRSSAMMYGAAAGISLSLPPVVALNGFTPYIALMKRTIVNIFFGFLIAAYGNSAVMSSVLLLREFLNARHAQYQLTDDRTSQQQHRTPAWTVKSHTVPAVLSELSTHVGSPNDECTHVKNHRIHHYFHFVSQYTYLESLPSKPRDPPLA